MGRELGVDYVIEGSVQKKGNGLRITAQLIDTHTNVHVWADGYEGSDPSSLQDEAIRKIVATLSGQTGPSRSTSTRRPRAKPRPIWTNTDTICAATKSSPDTKALKRTTAQQRSGGKAWRSSRTPRCCACRWPGHTSIVPGTLTPPNPPPTTAEPASSRAKRSPARTSRRWCGASAIAHGLHPLVRGRFRPGRCRRRSRCRLAPYYAGQLSFLARVQIASGNTTRGLEWVQESVRLDPTLRGTRGCWPGPTT